MDRRQSRIVMAVALIAMIAIIGFVFLVPR